MEEDYTASLMILKIPVQHLLRRSVMSTNDEDSDKSNGKISSDGIKQEDREANASEMVIWESEECSPEMSAQFRLEVAAYEQAPWTTYWQLLEEADVKLTAPETMDDGQLTTKLWEVIEGLARKRIFLSQTNHLSDRELYTLLWRDVLREAIKDLPLDESSAWHIDLAETGSEENTYLYMKYYADEETRQRWLIDFPEDRIPPHEEPPHDRDRYLPQMNDDTQTKESSELM
jgi:hypothetical protein